MSEGNILVSECLTGCPCRMDGQSKPVQAVINLMNKGLVVPVCPEVLGGLPTPRDPSEMLADGRVLNCKGVDNTAAFVEGAKKAFEIGKENGCKVAILKAKSPSCGKGVIHNGKFDGGLVEGSGVFAQMLMDAGIEVLTEKELTEEVIGKLIAESEGTEQ